MTEQSRERVWVAIHWDYEQTSWGPIGRTREDVIRAIKETYGPPYIVEWQETDDELIGEFEAVMHYSTKHRSVWEITEDSLVSYTDSAPAGAPTPSVPGGAQRLEPRVSGADTSNTGREQA